jgi:hypothetical protein
VSGWFEQMKAHIAGLGECDRADQWSKSMLAVHWRLRFVGYHRDEYRRLLDDALADFPAIDRERFLLFASSPPFSSEQSYRLQQAKFRATANIIAAAQSLHAACDIICQVAYHALELKGLVRRDRLNIHQIVKKSVGSVNIEFEKLSISPQFTYLCAFVNVNKHVHLIQSLPAMDFTQGERGGLRVIEFSYSNPFTKAVENHAGKWVEDFLQDDCESIVTQLNNCGVALTSEML